MSIVYVEGDALEPVTKAGRVIIAHVCNDVGYFGAGFALSVARKWPVVARRFQAWARGTSEADGPFGLGMVQLARAYNNRNHPTIITVANMVAQHGLRSPTNPQPLDYLALGLCLHDLSMRLRGRGFADTTVHMPRIGTGLAGGSWDRIEPIISDSLVAVGLPTYVYDLPRR